MKITLLHFLIGILVFSSCADKVKTKNTSVISSLYEEYLEENYKKSEGFSYSGNEEEGWSVKHPDHDFTLSSVSINVLENTVGDFNKDGISDMWVEMMDEGMGGGGNMYMDYIGIVQLYEKKPKFIPYFINSKFSDVYYLIENIEKDHIEISVGINHQGSYAGYKDIDENIKVGFRNDTLYPLSYVERCSMAEMKNKNVFKEDIKAERKQTINELLNLKQEEEFSIKDRTYSASISGCNDIELYFGFSAPENISNEKLEKEFISFLLENTRYTSVLKQLIENTKYEELFIEEEPRYQREIISFDEGWGYLTSLRNYDNRKIFSLLLYKE